MKSRAHIKELNDIRLVVAWPEYSGSFHHFKALLKKVLTANFDGPVVSTLEYGEDEKIFYITLSVQSTLAGPFGDHCLPQDRRTGFTLKKLFEIHPLEPIGSQIQQALNVYEELKEKHALLQILYNEHMGQK
jgi:hypothetical protein